VNRPATAEFAGIDALFAKTIVPASQPDDGVNSLFTP
jgi:hypothetical protein